MRYNVKITSSPSWLPAAILACHTIVQTKQNVIFHDNCKIKYTYYATNKNSIYTR